ncbi:MULTISPECIES: hypothetical protein [Pseudomonas]|uniref:hypothetical protein n=1 Tax=Pseudomonas TaxID=286 RepID=UPI00110C9888|nr:MULTISPECIES: hypothetical protein [Pseudomonas]
MNPEAFYDPHGLLSNVLAVLKDYANAIPLQARTDAAMQLVEALSGAVKDPEPLPVQEAQRLTPREQYEQRKASRERSVKAVIPRNPPNERYLQYYD